MTKTEELKLEELAEAVDRLAKGMSIVAEQNAPVALVMGALEVIQAADRINLSDYLPKAER